MNKIDSKTAIDKSNQSFANKLAQVGLPAIMLTLGLAPMEAQDAGIIVAGGTEVIVSDIAATQLCQPCVIAATQLCQPCVIAATQLCQPCVIASGTLSEPMA